MTGLEREVPHVLYETTSERQVSGFGFQAVPDT